MKTTSPLSGVLGLCLILTTCVRAGDEPKAPDKGDSPKRVPFGPKNIFVEIEGPKDNQKRRVIIEAAVCLREGQLEQLLTRKQTKEHEAILAVDADARYIKAALLLAGAKEGSTVK